MKGPYNIWHRFRHFVMALHLSLNVAIQRAIQICFSRTPCQQTHILTTLCTFQHIEFEDSGEIVKTKAQTGRTELRENNSKYTYIGLGYIFFFKLQIRDPGFIREFEFFIIKGF